jgi:two-component system, NtrC family, response regulator AtoC
MNDAALTPLEIQILETAALMMQPFDLRWLAKSIRKPHRGVINQAGQLCRKGLLAPDTISGKYFFTDPNLAKRYEAMFSDDKKHEIYTKLWRAVSREFNRNASADTIMKTVWAALKAKTKDSETLICESLSLAFQLVDDILVRHILTLCDHVWPRKYPNMILVRQAEFLHLQGNTNKAINLLKSIKTDNTNCIQQINILVTQMNMNQNSAYPVVAQLKNYIASGYDIKSLSALIKQVVLLYQESGFLSESERLIQTFYAKTENFRFEYFWLSGRQCILKGDLDNALVMFQRALNEIGRDVNRYAAAFVMLDIAKIHGIRGNPVKEGHCLKLAEHLVQRGKREYFYGKLMLYRIEMALESGNFDDAAQYIVATFDACPEVGSFQLAVAAYCGLIMAFRLNSPGHYLQYAETLFKNPEMIPGELIVRVYYALEEKYLDCNKLNPPKIKSVLRSLHSKSLSVTDNLTKDDNDVSVSDLAVAEFLRMGHRASDLLVKEASKTHPPDAIKIKRAVRISEQIRDIDRKKRFVSLLNLEMVQEKGIVSPEKHQFYSFIDELMSVESEEQFGDYLHEFFTKTFDVCSGVFLIESPEAWRWSENWGRKLRLKEQRELIRLIEKTRALKRNVTLLSNHWMAIRFPLISSDHGLLLLQKKQSQSLESVQDNAEKELSLIVGLIVLVRQLLKFKSAQPLSRMFSVSPDYADRVIGKSPKIKKIRQIVRRIADSPVTVHIHGETGTGKELIARAIHFCGRRKHYPFVAFNCATSSETLIESELFGHKRGAFTGAFETRKGIFQSAQGGTVFLDEVSDLPISVQAKLLRVLQEKRVRSLGSDQDTDVDVRILSATHRDLSDEVRKGNFRSDLFYRLVVVNVLAPALRDRPEDILLLAEHFLCKAMKSLGSEGIRLSARARKWMLNRYWHGNVRELQNLMEVAANFSPPSGVIDATDLSEWVKSSVDMPAYTLAQGTRQYQLDLIKKVLESNNGNISRSAQVLGISRQTLCKKMKLMDSLACEHE